MEHDQMLAERGTARALRDLVIHLSPALPGEAAWLDRLVAINEVLFWLYSLHEYHRRKFGNERFYQLLDSHPQGQTLRGLMWVRGIVQHHQSEMTYMEYSGGVLVGSVHWVPSRDVIFNSGSKGRDPQGAQAYDAHVHGKEFIGPPIEAFTYLCDLSRLSEDGD